MTTFAISNAAQLAACNSIVDRCEVGTPPAQLKIRTGAHPATCELADSGTILAEVNLPNPAFSAAADVAPGGQAALLGVPLSDLSINNTGTAGHFRIYQGPAFTTCEMQGDVGTASTTMIVNSTAFQSGATFTITSLTVKVPET